MLSLALLVAFGAVECACIHLTRRPGAVATSAAHLLLVTAMVAMLAAPNDSVVVVGVTCIVSAMIALSVVQRGGKAGSLSVCSGQLIACAVATLTMLLAMAFSPAVAPGPKAAVMVGMPGMAPGLSTGSYWLPIVTASVILVFFALRAVLETLRALRTHRVCPAALRHSAAAAGSLSMVVMCAAMGAF